jgi:hypothetical protein
MLPRTLPTILVALPAIWLCPAVVQGQFGPWESALLAQSPSGQMISGAGTVTLQRPPSALRMYVEVFARGKTLEEALAKLKDRKEAARMQIEGLRGDPKSIEFDAPRLSNLKSEQKRRMESMIIERMRSTGRKVPKALQRPKSVTVSATLTAEWPLETESPEACLLAAHSLQEKIKAANLAGQDDAEELSPEEEEMAEEMAEMGPYSGEEEIKPGTPHFVYVARITDRDRDRAMAEAFGKAHANAARLARAAGARLGPLVGLSGRGGGSDEESMYYDSPYGYQYQEYVQRLMGRRRHSRVTEEKNETVGSNPGSLEFAFSVNAVFSLEKP